MYIETSGSRHAGDKAHLESPTVSTDPSTKCLRFWYHMYGATIGQLNVYLRAGAGLGPAIWTRRGTQGNKWIQGQIVINKTSAFTVIFIIMIFKDHKYLIWCFSLKYCRGRCGLIVW